MLKYLQIGRLHLYGSYNYYFNDIIFVNWCNNSNLFMCTGFITTTSTIQCLLIGAVLIICYWFGAYINYFDDTFVNLNSAFRELTITITMIQ